MMSVCPGEEQVVLEADEGQQNHTANKDLWQSFSRFLFAWAFGSFHRLTHSEAFLSIFRFLLPHFEDIVENTCRFFVRVHCSFDSPVLAVQ